MRRMQIYAAILADAAAAVARLHKCGYTREDVAAAMLPFKAARREGAAVDGCGLISFWGFRKEIERPREYVTGCRAANFGHGVAFAVDVDADNFDRMREIIDDAEDRLYSAWDELARRCELPQDVAELMQYAVNIAERALSGEEYSKDDAAGKGIYKDFTPGHYNDIVDALETELTRLANKGRGGATPGGKQVSIYQGRENITGDGDYLGWALSLPNDGKIIFHKSGDAKKNAMEYTYNPAAVKIVDALIDAFQDSKKNGWIHPREQKLIKPGGRWQNKFSLKATLTKAIESDGARGKCTGNIRIRPRKATKAKR